MSDDTEQLGLDGGESQAVTKAEKPAANTSNVPAVVENYAVMQMDTSELADIVRENVGAQGIDQFDLTRVKVPSGGGTTWEIPTLDGIEETKVIEGVIVAWTEVRAYWATPLEESDGNSPPDCSSSDCVTGHGDPGGSCDVCPFAQYGSAAKGDGQACKQARILFMIREGDMLPIVVSCPPTSLKPMKQFMLRMASSSVPYYGATVKLALEKDRNASGITYAKITPSLGERLDRETTNKFRGIGAMFRPAVDAAASELRQEDI